jgi:hypothetical protein
LVYSFLKFVYPVGIFAADVDIDSVCLYSIGSNYGALNKEVWVELKEAAIFTGAGFRLVAISGEVAGDALFFGGHEAPFEAGIESSTAPASDIRGFDFLDHLGRGHFGEGPPKLCITPMRLVNRYVR